MKLKFCTVIITAYFSGIRQQKQEEKLRLVAGVFTRKASRQETRFVVPQIFIHRHSLCYGSQQVVPYTFELEDYRRGSTSSVSSRKSSLSSRKSSMSGRDSIISFDGRLFWPDSRRGSSSSRKSSDGNLSLLPDDRRGSGSSRSSRKSSDGGLSLINDYDRRGSNSSRKSSDGGLIPFFSDYDRRGSNSSRSSRKSSDAGHSNLSFEGTWLHEVNASLHVGCQINQSPMVNKPCFLPHVYCSNENKNRQNRRHPDQALEMTWSAKTLSDVRQGPGVWGWLVQ